MMLREGGKLYPLRTLFAVDQYSPEYNEGSKRGMFYAESWALVHMLMSGQPDRSAQFAQYVRVASRGVPAETAWRDAFGSFDAIGELKKYLSRNIVNGRLHKFDQAVKRVGDTTVRVSAAEAELSRVEAGAVSIGKGTAAAVVVPFTRHGRT